MSDDPRPNEQCPLLSETSERVLLKKSFLSCAIATLVASQVSFMSGIAQGYSAILLPQLEDNATEFSRISIHEASWIASLGTAFRPMGAMIEGILVEKYGRRTTLMLTAFLFSCCWLLMALARDLFLVYLSRTLISFVLGMVICVGLYVVEISLPQHRGTLLSFITPLTTLGTLCVYILGSLIPWHYCAIAFAIYSIVILATLAFIPESHIWYILKEREEEAVYSLLRFRNNDLSQVSYEINDMQLRLRDQQKRSLLTEFYDPAVWKPFLIMSLFTLFQQQTGFNMIVYYAVDFFSSLRTDLDSYTLSIIFASVSTVGSIVLSLIIHMYNRKTLLTASGIGMFTMMIISTVSVYIQEYCTYRLVSVGSVFLYMFCCMLGMIDIPWMLIGELFPTRVRGLMSASLTVVIFFITFVAIKSYPFLFSLLGKTGITLYFSVFSLISIIIVQLFVPETREKSLFEIEEYFRQ